MTLKAYFQENLVILEKGTPILLTARAGEMEKMSVLDTNYRDQRNYLLRWGGMTDVNDGGFSEDGKMAYFNALGEIFQLGHVWENRPFLVLAREVFHDGLSYVVLEHEPTNLRVGRDAILSKVGEEGLANYRSLLEELL